MLSTIVRSSCPVTAWPAGRKGPILRTYFSALVVVAPLPVGQRGLGISLGCEPVLTPEFLLVDAVTAFDLPILLRPARIDVPVADARSLDRELEGQRELGPVVARGSLRMTNGSSRRSTSRNRRPVCWFCLG